MLAVAHLRSRSVSTKIACILTSKHRFEVSRRIAPELRFVSYTLFRQRAQGRPGAGWHPRSTVRWLRYKNLYSGIQVKPRHPAFPAQWFDGLCRALPGERCTIAPVASRMADAETRSGQTHHRNTWRQPAGARTTRFCRRQITPIVCAAASLTVARPAKPSAPT